MKYLLLSLLLLSGCIIVDDPQCRRDSDCWSPADACISGECVFVGAPSGEVTTGCNCTYTNDLPGSAYENDWCYSGVEILVECSYDCCIQNVCYPAWATICL
jgi:hypothetical protein